MRSTVLLDAGGVLLDESEHEEHVCITVVQLIRSAESSYTREQYWRDTAEAITRFCPSTPRYVLWKQSDHDRTRFELWWTRLRDALHERPAELRLFPEMVAEIPALADRFRVVMAGQYGEAVYDLLAAHHLDRYFANRLSQDDFPITKPDPRYLAHIAEASGVPTAACIMVGDRIDKDVIPAKQNGMGTVFVRTGIYRDQEPRTPEETPDLVLQSCRGLSAAVAARWRRQEV